MAAEITFDQPLGAGPGTPGEARNDIWVSQVVNLVSSGTGTSWLWEILDAPPGSAVSVSNPTLSTANITPDLVGTYRISLTVDGGGAGNVAIKVIRARFDSSGVILEKGWALPAVDEQEDEANYPGNLRHWAEPWETIMAQVRQNLTRVLVFQPGGTAGGNVYTDWALLMVAHGETAGPKVIEMDSSYDGSSICLIPAGTYDLGYNTIIRGHRPGSAMVFDDGAVFQDALLFEGFLDVHSGSSSDVFTWTGPASLCLKGSVTLSGDSKAGHTPTAPLITTASTVYLYDQSSLAASSGDQPVLEDSSGSTVRMFDGSSVIPADGGASDSYALNVTGPGAITVEIYSSGARYQHVAVSGLSWEFYSIRRETVSFTKGSVSNGTSTPISCGAGYLSLKNIPKFTNTKCYFRAIIETTSGSVGSEAYVDLFDVFGQLNAGVPQVVSGSQLDTGTGSPPSGAPTPNPLLPSLYELDITSAIIGGTWVSDIAILEARVWIGTASGGNAATCKSAELVFEWTEN